MHKISKFIWTIDSELKYTASLLSPHCRTLADQFIMKTTTGSQEEIDNLTTHFSNIILTAAKVSIKLIHVRRKRSGTIINVKT